MINNRDLKEEILRISYENKLSHIGSCLCASDIINEIYTLKKKDEKFVLSQGHAGLALYVVLQKFGLGNAEDLLHKCGIHPDRLMHTALDCSTGSLGHGIGIALGMALADRTKNVYCLISDGELAEGSVHEALRIKRDNHVDNLIVYVNHNGYSAYEQVELEPTIVSNLDIKLKRTDCSYLPFLEGLEGHYHVMTEDDYKLSRVIFDLDMSKDWLKEIHNREVGTSMREDIGL